MQSRCTTQEAAPVPSFQGSRNWLLTKFSIMERQKHPRFFQQFPSSGSVIPFSNSVIAGKFTGRWMRSVWSAQTLIVSLLKVIWPRIGHGTIWRPESALASVLNGRRRSPQGQAGFDVINCKTASTEVRMTANQQRAALIAAIRLD